MLEQRDKELAAIGASIGANCRPCIEHHISAGRTAGLSQREISDAVAAAEAVRQQAIEELSARAAELLGEPVAARRTDGGPRDSSAARELVALGASVGANGHALLRLHIAAAAEAGLSPGHVRAAVQMAEHVQRRAGEITAEKAQLALDELTGVAGTPLVSQGACGCG